MSDRVATGTDGLETLPCNGIRPSAGELIWYLDQAACGG